MKAIILTILLCVPVWASNTTLTGTITDASGNPLNGILTMQLPVPAQDTTLNVQVSNSPVTFNLVNGAIVPVGNATLKDVATLQPQGLYYAARGYDTAGNLQFYGNYAVTGASFNLGLATPTVITTSNVSYLNPAVTSGNNIFTGNNALTGQNSIISYSSNGVIHLDGLKYTTLALAAAACPNPGVLVVDTPGTWTVSSNLTIPATCTLQVYQGATISIATAVTLTINGPIVAVPNVQIFTYTGTGVASLGNLAVGTGVPVTWFPGSDIGAQINAAYAALPSQGGKLIIPPSSNGSCYSFSTGILFTTANKYPILQGPGGAANGTSSFSNCLNYTPTSGIAIEMGYVPSSPSAAVQQHGIRDLILWNNSCVTSGGCGGTAFGIDSQNVGLGNSGATFENVAIIGFAFAYNVSNTTNVPGTTWINPLWEFNSVVWTNGNNTNNVILGGYCTGNTECIQATTGVGGEYIIEGMSVAVNSGPVFDFTRATAKVTATFLAVHFEDSTAIGNVHFIAGLCSCRIYGGTMETDQTSGTGDEFITIATGGALEIHGLDLFSAGRTFTQVFLLNGTARANVQIFSNSTTAFPTLCGQSGGSGCTSSLFLQIAANTNTSIAGPTPTIGNTSQKAETGSADANVLTVTPPSLAGTYRACFTASVSSATAGVIAWTLSYKNSNSVAQTNDTMPITQQGTAAPNVTFTTSAAGEYQGCWQFDIDNSGTAIVVKWVGGGTTAAKVSATVERMI